MAVSPSTPSQTVIFASPPTIHRLFESHQEQQALIEDPTPLRIEEPYNQQGMGLDESALIEIDVEKEETEELTAEDIITDPAAYLPIIFPWLQEHGMCIMPMPSRQKISNSAKKKAQWVHELQNLYSTVNYDKISTGLIKNGSRSSS